MRFEPTPLPVVLTTYCHCTVKESYEAMLVSNIYKDEQVGAATPKTQTCP